MEKSKEQKERQRREYAPDGQRSQKMVSFRCDNENFDWLNMQLNKGRAINRLIEEARKKGVK